MPMFVLLLYIGERCDGNNAGRGEITRSDAIRDGGGEEHGRRVKYSCERNFSPLCRYMRDCVQETH